MSDGELRVDAIESAVDSDGMKLNVRCWKACLIYKSSVRAVAPVLPMAVTLF